MQDATRAFYLFVLAGGIVVVLFMLTQLRATLKKGAIERRAPFRPFTKSDNPKVFWGFIVWTAVATAGIIWGLAVIVSRFLDQ